MGRRLHLHLHLRAEGRGLRYRIGLLSLYRYRYGMERQVSQAVRGDRASALWQVVPRAVTRPELGVRMT